METSEKFDSPNPRLKANVISKIFFCWLIPLFCYGRRNEIEPKDIHKVLPREVSETLGNQLESYWKEELEYAKNKKTKPNFHKAILRTFFWPFIYIGIYSFVLTVVIKLLQPIALSLLIRHFSPGATSTTNEAYLYASGVVLMGFMESIIICHITYSGRELGMQVRVACSSLIYRKVMRLSCASASQGGHVLTLLSNDVTRFEQVYAFLNYVWITPIQLIVVAYLTWMSVGVASLAGIVCMVLQTIPLQIYFGRLTHAFRHKIAVQTDGRVSLTSEIINGIRVIKMYTWEPIFKKLVCTARKLELAEISVLNYLKGVVWASGMYSERTSVFCCILVYTLQNNILSADKIYSVVQLFCVLQFTFGSLVPRGLHFYAESQVSAIRIQNFLLSEEIETTDRKRVKSGEANISISKVTASWTKESITDTLQEVNATVPAKSLCAVVGPVGAGKSSLLKLILGELRPSIGRVDIQGSVSYASQEPWLFSGSVRNNILFGQSYDEEKYNKVTKACCLTEDFKQLPYGDRTLVGEKGSALSGGQCARVNLARAVYRDADIYLLDDPLSAVDTRVGKRLFEDCINGYLKGKIRVLVTHQMQCLIKADVVVYLKRGIVEFQGDFENFQMHDQQFLYKQKNHANKRQLSVENMVETEDNGLVGLSKSDVDNKQEEPIKNEEQVAKGSLSLSLYWQYFKANGSYCLLFVYLVVTISAQVFTSGSDYWVSYWINQDQTRMRVHYAAEGQNSDANVSPYLDRTFALNVMAILVFGCVIFATAKNVLFYIICKRSSYNIHNRMIDSVLKATVNFFDANSSGRILNRFSKDLGAVDEVLSLAMMDSFQVFSLVTGVVVQIIIIHWWMIVPMCIMLIININIHNVYLQTARCVKRLEGNTKSLVLAHVNSTLDGRLTIRSCQAESMVCKVFDHHQDAHTATFSLVLTTSTAFGFWVDLIAMFFVALVTYSFVVLGTNDFSGSAVGLAITQILSITILLQHGMKMSAEMVTQMVGVERLFQFTHLEEEGPLESKPGKKPPKSWPCKGELEFVKLNLRYNDGADTVLKNLNLKIEPGMKVGIVGRTGAGKSSLISALFRLVKVEGGLIIDGVDTTSIGLRDLRSKLSIIPQEPILFTTTLRDNLDPFHEIPDDALWSALQDVELNKAFVSLDQSVDQSGGSLSAGQRQLLCLARAIVKRNKILVLDEATANVDPATDALIQKTIRINFKDCTVLTIAHRLNTIMDSDRVLVMNFGEAVEFEHPYILLQNHNGYFYKMVEQTGSMMAKRLEKIAEKAYKS